MDDSFSSVDEFDVGAAFGPRSAVDRILQSLTIPDTSSDLSPTLDGAAATDAVLSADHPGPRHRRPGRHPGQSAV
jgi:hypothetical protein